MMKIEANDIENFLRELLNVRNIESKISLMIEKLIGWNLEV